MTPDAKITVNGAVISSEFANRLISLNVTDNSGANGDTISCDLNDGSPFIKIPNKGDLMKVWLGYKETGLTYFGEYTIESPVVHCLPYGLSINGKSASMRDTLKQQKTRHWDGKSLSNIMKEIASEHGLRTAISSDVAAFQYDWIGQQNESDLNFCTRLAARHGAVFSIKNGTLILSKRGNGYSASGNAMNILVITPNMIVPGSCDIEFSAREHVGSVKARHYSRKKAELVNVEEESSPSGTAVHTLPHPYADEEEARAAASSKAASLYMETTKVRVVISGNSLVRAGVPFIFANVRPGVDDIAFIVDSASHMISKDGYITMVEGHAAASENVIAKERASKSRKKKTVKLVNVEE
ncbi:MAG: phage late control D family protein [Acetobacter sp.]|nr:phage late control D family protein [Acetobacter sp.]